jgi:hypothetical protein
VTRTGAAIQARELTKTYGKGTRALDGLGSCDRGSSGGVPAAPPVVGGEAPGVR